MDSRSWRLFLYVFSCLMCCYGEDPSVSVCTFTSRNDTRLRYPDILYYQVSSSNYSMHYAWSMVGAPTLFVAKTDGSRADRNCSSSISVNISEFADRQSYGSVAIDGMESNFSLAIAFTRIIMFNTTKSMHSKLLNLSELFDPSQNYHFHSLNLSGVDYPTVNKTWTFNESNQSAFNTSYSFSENDTFSFINHVKVSNEQGRLPYFPKTAFSENSTAFDFTFTNLKNYNDSTCVAMEMVLVHGAHTANGTVNSTSFFDDEYTPSVFSTGQYLFGDQGYFQWKPISYLTDELKSRTSTSSVLTSIVFNDTVTNKYQDIPSGLASALFNGSGAAARNNVTRLYVVFGSCTDTESDFTWSAVIGHGTVPVDTMSVTVMIILIVGLGLPAVIIFVGLVAVLFIKKPWKKAAAWVTKHRLKKAGYVVN